MARTIPILRVSGTLLVPVQIALSNRLILELEDAIAHEIHGYDPHGLVIEVSGVDAFDSVIAGAIQSVAKVARLMGVRTLVAGLSAGMAITLVEMGMSLDGVETALDLEGAFDLLGHGGRPERASGRAAQQKARDEALLFEGDDP